MFKVSFMCMLVLSHSISFDVEELLTPNLALLGGKKAPKYNKAIRMNVTLLICYLHITAASSFYLKTAMFDCVHSETIHLKTQFKVFIALFIHSFQTFFKFILVSFFLCSLLAFSAHIILISF